MNDAQDLNTLAPPEPVDHPHALSLRSGDRLTREEFERRFDAMPHLLKAELIEGVVSVPSPVRYKNHGSPQLGLITWAGLYVAGTPGTSGADNTSIRLGPKDMLQPDLCLIVLPEYGGQTRIDADDYLVGGPEWVAEVAASSASHDLERKLPLYRRHQVHEYLVWRVLDRAIDWFVLRAGQYEPMALSDSGFYQSEVHPGLWLDPAALIAGDLPKVFKVVQNGLQAPEHAAYVDKLRAAANQLRGPAAER